MNLGIQLVFYLVILLIAITLHEFSHAWVGHLLGDITAKREGRLSLNPLAHIDPLYTLGLPLLLILIGSPVVFGAAKPVPFNPYAVRYGKWGAAMIAVSGPLTNFLLAAIVGLYLRFVPITAGSLPETFLVDFVLLNLAFFVFNLIPIPPLDGSRVLYAIAPPAMADVMERIEQYGLIGVILVLFVFYRFLSPVISTSVQALSTWLIGRSVF